MSDMEYATAGTRIFHLQLKCEPKKTKTEESLLTLASIPIKIMIVFISLPVKMPTNHATFEHLFILPGRPVNMLIHIDD